jgi:hypothetical protein
MNPQLPQLPEGAEPFEIPIKNSEMQRHFLDLP